MTISLNESHILLIIVDDNQETVWRLMQKKQDAVLTQP